MSEVRLDGQPDLGASSAGGAPSSWWRPGAPATSRTISTGRAYTEVLLVFGAFFGASVALALLDLAGRLNGGSSAASWADYGPAAFNLIAHAGLAVLVVVLLGQARGCSPSDMGMKLRRDSAGRVMFWAEVRVAAWAILALLTGGFITSVLKTGSIPPGSATVADLIYRSAHSIEAGFMEECVVLGFLVATLRQARRPIWEIVAVALLLRVSYHLYYGPGALGILVWASVFIWVYLRTRSLIPLIVVHCLWDLVATFTPHWHAVGGLSVLAMLTVLVAAPISWLVQRSAGGGGAAGLAAAGWHPDPSGQHRWRWWDGAGWTATVFDDDGNPRPSYHAEPRRDGREVQEPARPVG